MHIIFGKKLKELRKENNLTQLELAKILDVSKTTICQWETSKQEPSLEIISKLAYYFDVTTDYLLGIEDESGKKIKLVNKNIYNINGEVNINFKDNKRK